MNKKITVVTFLVTFLICSFLFSVTAQNSKTQKINIKKEIPTVFLLGEFDKEYEDMMVGQTTLLNACGNDMNMAYGKLMAMMREMEAYAVLVGFDLKGINAWMHFFWQPDGTIDHIGFYPKPTSKNVDVDLLKHFLDGFANQYKLPIKSSKKFSHYSSISFPVVKHEPNPDNLRNTAKATSPKGF